MTDDKIYVNAVASVDPSVSKTCRPAIAWLKSSKDTAGFYGFVVGDMYFINKKTLKIYKKTACSLINYIDDFED